MNEATSTDTTEFVHPAYSADVLPSSPAKSCIAHGDLTPYQEMSDFFDEDACAQGEEMETEIDRETAFAKKPNSRTSDSSSASPKKFKRLTKKSQIKQEKPYQRPQVPTLTLKEPAFHDLVNLDSDESQSTQDANMDEVETPRLGDGSQRPTPSATPQPTPVHSPPASPVHSSAPVEDTLFVDEFEPVEVKKGITFQISPTDEHYEEKTTDEKNKTRSKLFKIDCRSGVEQREFLKSSYNREKIKKLKNKCEREWERYTMDLLCAGKVPTMDLHGSDTLVKLNQFGKKPFVEDTVFENVIEYVSYYVSRYMKACSVSNIHNTQNIVAMMLQQQRLMDAMNSVFGENISDGTIMYLDWRLDEYSNVLRYSWVKKDRAEFRNLWNSTSILSYNKNNLVQYNFFSKEREKHFNTVKVKKVPIRDEEGEITGYEDKYEEPFIKIQAVPLGDWWLGEGDHRRYTKTVYEPDPKKCLRGDVNLWPGYAFNAELVKDFTDWRKCDFILRHLKYTLCDLDKDDSQFEEFLGRCTVIKNS
jgi:hypothetical protein